ncbi:MAG: ribosome silencing factor [Puniceicoccales bacterium]|jgi:ribosome-associated protein|nr:ribosome silencing factor [Puniceicoccales bacterium]
MTETATSRTKALKKTSAPKTASAKKPARAARPKKAAAPDTPDASAAVKKPVRKRAAPRKAAGAAPSLPAAPIASLPENAPPVLELCVRVLDEKKAEEISIFDVRERSSVTDFFVIATATSEPHLRALRVAVEKEFAAAGEKIHGGEAGSGTGWTVVDAIDVIIHLFLPARRAACQLETLWSAGVRRKG